jgi:hypothetical protein
MGHATMHITTADDALDHARAEGFIEAVFTPTDSDSVPGDGDPEIDDLTRWGRECRAAGRHGVIVGELPYAYFVMMVLRESPPDLQYVLEAFRDAFRCHFDCEPNVDVEVPDEQVWSGPKTFHEVAIAAARELVAIDRQERDDDLEVTFGIMTS